MPTITLTDAQYTEVMLSLTTRNSILTAHVAESITPEFWQRKLDINNEAVQAFRKQYNAPNVPA